MHISWEKLILVYQNKSKRGPYSTVHFEEPLEIERDSEEILAIQND